MNESHPLHSKKHKHHHSKLVRLKARWPAWVALLIVGVLYEALPPVLYWGPRGLLISLVVLLTIPMIITYWRDDTLVSRILGLSINILITFYMIMSVILIVFEVLQGRIGPTHLLISALTLWVANILVFALWYWNLDAGGPHQRELQGNARYTAFLFPQAQISITLNNQHLTEYIKKWEPNFIDYLFLAFNTSTAFSPTDTPVLTRWAKFMCMIQSLISLTIVVMLAARAINILNPATSYIVS